MIVALLLATAMQGPAAPQVTFTLTDALDRALASHPSVQVARAVHDHALADLGDARSQQRPRVSLDASLSQFEQPMVVLPLHGFDPRNPPLFDRSLVQTGVSAGWTVYDFGVRAARVRAQSLVGDATAAGVTTVERQLLARTATAYINVLTARDVLAAHDQRIAALAAASDRVRQLVAQGKSARVDQLRVDAALRSAQADRIASASQLALAEDDLAQLTGVPAATVRRGALSPLRVSDSVYAADTSDRVRGDLVQRAYQTSSEVREAHTRARAAAATLDVAKALTRPEIRASGAYVDRGRLAGTFAAEWNVGLALSYPLYAGGSLDRGVDRATADERAATAQARAAELAVETALDHALAAVREAHARAIALQSAVDQSAEVARIEQLSIDVGSGTQTEFLDAEANLLSVRSSLTQAQHAEMSARVDLARLLGELSRDWLARTMEQRQ